MPRELLVGYRYVALGLRMDNTAGIDAIKGRKERIVLEYSRTSL